MEYANLSVDEIQRQIDEAKNREAELQRALEVRRQEAKSGLVEQIRSLIEDQGYDLSEIVALLEPKRRRGAGTRKSAGNRQYTRYVDPENPENIYVRGVLPGWMKQKMADHGLDPSSKEDRETFKVQHLQVLEG